MKYLLILITVFFSCKKETHTSIEFGQPFFISPGTKVSANSNELLLSFEKVASDSRCPSNAMCVWLGVAELNLTLTKKGTSYPFSLYTTDFKEYYTDTTVAGYSIQLKSLLPYPLAGTNIQQKEYKAEIIIRK
jgi:hypothetical protein